MHGCDRSGSKNLHDEVAVGHRIERIGHRPIEAERLGGHVAVECERGAGERRSAERRFVEPLARVGKPAAVARRHLDIGKQMMAEGHRLRRLHMGEAGHHSAGMRQRLLGERALIAGERGIKRVNGIAHPQPEIGRHLIVARARGMQPAGRLADQLGQPALHVHVDVFERPLERELAGLDF